MCTTMNQEMHSGAQFEGDLGEILAHLGEILALGAEISPYIVSGRSGSLTKKKKKKKNFFKFSSCQHTIDKL